MRVLVTGGAGFVGSHLVDLLVEAGHEVVSLDRLHPRAHAGRPDYLRQDVEHVDADLADPVAARVLDRVLDGVDAVSHQAAMVGLGREVGDVVEFVRDNDLGTAALLAALARHGRVGRLVLASSMVVYGEGAYRCPEHGPVRPGPRPAARLDAGRFEPPCPRCGTDLEPVAVAEDAPPDPRSVYAATKLHQEHLATARPAAHRSPRCATTTSMGRGCPATPPMPGWRPSSAAPWPVGGPRRCMKTAGSDATSST
jgi:dTDP-L-rhamnose 4-epimerase